MTSPLVEQLVEVLRQSKSSRATMRRIQERFPAATAADIAEAVGIVAGVQLDHASLREPATRFRKPVQRRCDNCRHIFQAQTSDEMTCPGCTATLRNLKRGSQ